jgi:uncharacterized protein
MPQLLAKAARATSRTTAVVVSTVVEGKETEGAKFRDWFDFPNRSRHALAPRAGAAARPQRRGMLRVALKLDETRLAGNAGESRASNPCE